MSEPDSKSRIYDVLLSINRGFHQVIRDLEELQELESPRLEVVRACAARVEGLRTEINQRVNEALQEARATDSDGARTAGRESRRL